MEHFEGRSGALGVICSEKLCLGDEGFGFKPDLISPTDEVREVDVEGEILMTGVLVGFGWGKTLMLEVGSQGSEGSAVVYFFSVAAIVDGEHFAAGPLGELIAIEFLN